MDIALDSPVEEALAEAVEGAADVVVEEEEEDPVVAEEDAVVLEEDDKCHEAALVEFVYLNFNSFVVVEILPCLQWPTKRQATTI